VAYATECRRRVKEQMNKRKPDDEFARIDLSYFATDGREVVVYCPESRGAGATQTPVRKTLHPTMDNTPVTAQQPAAVLLALIDPPDVPPTPQPERLPLLAEKHYTIFYGETGHSYESILGPYLPGVKQVHVEDPYMRMPHQIQNFVRFCEAVVKHHSVRRIQLVTGYDDITPLADIQEKLDELKQSLLEVDVVLDVELNPALHDREIRLDNGWVIKIGRGLDFYQKPEGWYTIGANDLSQRKCLETKVDIYRVHNSRYHESIQAADLQSHKEQT
jgi:ATP-dependent Lon protease